ncbi:MAG TPA: glycoside hydrolase family 3 N-terminal domain-containing protein [Jatrophihabitantaceae bacterium]|nr:glycoside hydrolase family 3 N-terminal domain-containing protein [Jatrophihabitantaceae bacterium]
MAQRENGESLGEAEAGGVSRRSLLVGGAALLAGAGLLAPARAFAADPVGTSGTSMRSGPHHLSPAQQAGQRVIWSYPGLVPPQELLDAIRAGLVGGVIFFGENINRSDRSQIQAVTRELAQAQADSGIGYPLLLMTDQEGGIVQRLPGAPGISEKQIGASADPVATAQSAGTGAAENLLDAGMNCNLAPVLDVYRVPGNFDDQFGRSYSMDPQVCADCGAASVIAQQQLGVVTTAKHFPGLGAATRSQNTDLGPVTLDVPLSELRSIDELPFGSAIDAGVDMIMTSWATYPALDPDLPAGLSRTIVHDELRHRLRYRGVTITDAIEAGALQAFGDTGARAVLAADAGMDILLCSARDVSQGQQAVDAIQAAVANRRLDRGEAEQALRRVLALRRSVG